MAERPSGSPAISGILETVLYVDDLAAARDFYRGVLGLSETVEDARMLAYDVARRGMLLLFERGSSSETITIPGGTIPPHDGRGPAHAAFAIPADALAEWERHLASHRVAIEGRVTWPRGGRSIYFRDPSGNLLELATPGLWPGY